MAFDSTAKTGLGEFDIKPTAPPGTTIPGSVLIHYSVFSQDPNDPNFDPNTSTVVADATVSASVTINTPAAVPEPASVLLLAAAALPFAWSRRRTATAK